MPRVTASRRHGVTTSLSRRQGHCVTASWYVCVSASRRHSVTVGKSKVSLHHGVMTSLCQGVIRVLRRHCVTVSRRHGIAVFGQHGATVSQRHSVTLSRHHSVTVGMSECHGVSDVTASQYHGVTPSLCQDDVMTSFYTMVRRNGDGMSLRHCVTT